MSDIFLNTVEGLEPTLRAGELGDCEKIVVEKIEHLARSPFDVALEVNISDDPLPMTLSRKVNFRFTFTLVLANWIRHLEGTGFGGMGSLR
jgi:hypothetical protein